MHPPIISFPVPILNDAIGISVLQDLLVNLQPERIRDVQSACEGLVSGHRQMPISEVVHCFFVAAQYQPRRVPFLATLLRELTSTGLIPVDSILATLTRPTSIHGPRCFFLRELMSAEILPAASVVAKIRALLEFQPSHPEHVFTLFCWFAPEIQRFDDPLFVYILSSMTRYEGLSPALSNFLRLFEFFKANDWKVLKEATCFGFTPDWAVVAIARDEVRVLRENPDFTVHYIAPVCVFDCSPILDPGTPRLHAAAYFGSAKCFDYLLARGADPEAVSLRGTTLTQFAVAGGNPDMIKIVLGMRLDHERILHFSVKFHQNVLAEYFMDHFPHVSEDPWQEAFAASAEGNNVMFLLKCVEHKIRINEADIFDVSFACRKHHLQPLRRTDT
jgi:hypothetical protein